jgi:hypothetical protein
METTLQQLTENARTAYKNADKSGRQLLSDLFGKEVVPKKNHRSYQVLGGCL